MIIIDKRTHDQYSKQGDQSQIRYEVNASTNAYEEKMLTSLTEAEAIELWRALARALGHKASN